MPTHPTFARPAAVIVLAVSAAASAQPCTPAWSSAFSTTAPDNTVTAATYFDPDGPGPQGSYVIGGEFREIDGVNMSHIARWDGTAWQPLGTGLPGPVTDLSSFDPDGPGGADGRLVAAFHDGAAHAAAIFDGTTWTIITGSNAANITRVAGCTGSGPGGASLFLSGGSAIYRSDGNSLVEIGTTSGDVLALGLIDHDGNGAASPLLYAGGNFSSVSSVNTGSLGCWNGATWSPAGGPVTGGEVRTIAAHDPDGAGPQPICAAIGGSFIWVAGQASSYVAMWSGQQWLTLPSPLPGGVVCLQSADLDGPGPASASLVSSGAQSGVRRMGPSTWTPVGVGSFDQPPIAMAAAPNSAAHPPLVVGGPFSSYSLGDGRRALHVAQWTGSTWSSLGPTSTGGTNGTVSAFLTTTGASGLPAGALVVGGSFSLVGGLTSYSAAVWTGDHWHPLPQPEPAQFGAVVNCLAELDPDGAGPMPKQLIAGTTSPGSQVFAWTGTAWQAQGSLTSFYPQALVHFDPDGSGPQGVSTYAVGTRVNSSIVRWDGTNWVAAPQPAGQAVVFDAATFDMDGPGPQLEKLIIAGSQVLAGDGSTWIQLGSLSGGQVTSLCAFDEDGPGPLLPALFAAGTFRSSGALTVDGIARWNGTGWERVGLAGAGGLPEPRTEHIRDMAVLDPDGPGPESESLYVAGSFTTLLGVGDEFSGIARWDGAQWSTLPGPDFRGAYRLHSHDDDGSGPTPPALYMGGLFKTVGGQSSVNIARYGCSPVPCYANCDQSTTVPILNVADFTCFLQRFAAADPYANCDASTAPPTLNVADFTCFLQRFAAGCP